MNNLRKLLAGLLFFNVTTNILHGQIQPATNYGDNEEAGKYCTSPIFIFGNGILPNASSQRHLLVINLSR